MKEVDFVFGFDDTSMDHIDPKLREATSAAARLVFAAAKILDERCTLANVEEVMTAVRTSPEFRKDVFD